jgi:hypothetical protein
MNTTARWIGLVLLATAGCGAPAEDDGALDESTESVTVREGDYDLANAAGSGQPYVGVAVVGTRAYLAKGYEGLHVLDLRTMRVTSRLWNDRNNRRIPADGLQVIGRNQILAYWQGKPLGSLDDNREMLFLNVFNTTSQTVTRTVSIDLTGTYENPRSPINDLPSVEAHLNPTTNTLYVSFGHISQPDRLYAFPMPTGNASLRLTSIPGARTFTVENPHGVTVAGTTAWVPSSSQGIRAVDLTTGRASVRTSAIGYAVDIAVRNTTGFVADHNGNLQVLDLTNGRVKATRELPGFTDGLTLANGSVFVVWRNGVSVFRDVWSGR